MVRWLDDLLHVWPSDLSRPALRALRRMQARGFYGGTLELLEASSSVAFGFWVQTRNGKLWVREKFTYTRPTTHNTPQVQLAWPLLPPAWQFGVSKTNYATALGRYIRHLDCTNGVEEDVLSGMKRISSELIQADYSRPLLNKVIKQVACSANLDLKALIEFHGLPNSEIFSCAKSYDLFIHTLWVQKERYLKVQSAVLEFCQN